MNTLILAAALTLTQSNPKPVVIGTHYTDALAGLAVYRDAKESVVLTIGWSGKDGKIHHGYNELSNAKLRFGEAAPDDSYHRISWIVDGSTITYEWGLAQPGAAVARIRSTGPAHVFLGFGWRWPGSESRFNPSDPRYAFQAGSMKVAFNASGSRMSSGRVGRPMIDWREAYYVDKGQPLLFSIGVGHPPATDKCAGILDRALARYNTSRLWAEGDWGDFLHPIQNELGNSKVFSIDTGRVAHIVSRRWCLPDGQVLFCWDSFFNGLLASLEDPAGAKRTIRAVLAATTPAGFVANFSGRGWGRSDDRSQPPDGSYCVWKIYQRQPDLDFLREVYPKLLKWHDWWFAPDEPGHKPNRDGNADGLLEWGSETKDLQNAKYESGLDDSPMFDDAVMVGPNMNLDSTDLSSLWAWDAEYLSYIADAIGKHDDANRLRKEKSDMAKRMNEKLWNEAMGAYCYRYWTPRKATHAVAQGETFTADGTPGFRGEYFNGRDLKGDAVVRHDPSINFNWAGGPVPGIGHTNFSVRWSGSFTAPKTDPYQFKVTSDDGARLWMDGKLLVDAWTVHGATTYVSPTLNWDAGSTHDFKLEYFQAEGGAEAHLGVDQIDAEAPGQVFSSRLSPLNFYPLMADAPSKEQGRRTLDLFFRPDRFGGDTICPTISRNDPAYPAQGYWRGTVWGPTSYLTFQGVKKYASGSQLDEYATKSVALFMKNWNEEGTCRENFNVVGGKSTSDPHYTWGALMGLLGLEELCDTLPDGRIMLNGASGRHIKIHNLRLAGRLYDLRVEPREAVLSANGRTVAVARGNVKNVHL